MSMQVWFVLMIGMSASWLIWFLYRPLQGNDFNLQKSNIALGKQRQKELEQDLEGGLIDAQSFSQARDEITQTLAVELNQTTDNSFANNQSQNNYGSFAFVLIFLSVFSFGIYDALSPDKSQKLESVEQKVASLSLDESVIKLQEHLNKEPSDAKAWRMLGLTYFELDNLNESLKA